MMSKSVHNETLTKYTQKACVQAGGLYNIKFHTHDETLKDEKQHDAMDTDSSFLCCAKNWTRTPSASGSYGRQGGKNFIE